MIYRHAAQECGISFCSYCNDNNKKKKTKKTSEKQPGEQELFHYKKLQIQLCADGSTRFIYTSIGSHNGDVTTQEDIRQLQKIIIMGTAHIIRKVQM
jgi:hypothetical protein